MGLLLKPLGLSCLARLSLQGYHLKRDSMAQGKKLAKEVRLSLVGAVVGIVILGLIGVGVGFIVRSLTPAPPECDCRLFDLGCGLACSIAGSAYRAISLGTGMFGGLIGLVLGIPGGLSYSALT
jgi:hypothetical protein